MPSKRREEDDRRRHEQDQREPEPSDRGGDAAAIRDELRAEHRERDDGVLDAREDRECAEERERGLQAPRRCLDDADARVDGRKHERIGERVGEHPRCVDAVRNGDGKCRDGKREPLRQGQALAEQIGRNHRKRDERGVQALGEPERGHWIVRDEPDRRGDERV